MLDRSLTLILTAGLLIAIPTTIIKIWHLQQDGAVKVAGWEDLAHAGIVTGPSDAAVHLVEFSDFTCRYSAELHDIISELRDSGITIRRVYRHGINPNNATADAIERALAAECIQVHEGFSSAVKSRLYSTTGFRAGRLAPIYHDEVASCVNDGLHLPRIIEDWAEAQRIGLRGTPTFIINGELHVGVEDSDEVRALILASAENGSE